MAKNLILLGMMGAGKSTIGKILAKKLKFRLFDTDKLIEKKNLMTISEIFKKKGEDFFRDQEEKIVMGCLNGKDKIISLGGGAFINQKIRDTVLLSGVSFFLDVDLKTLCLRLEKSKKRPLLTEKDLKKNLSNLIQSRQTIYKLANHKINCNNLKPYEIADQIINRYEKH